MFTLLKAALHVTELSIGCTYFIPNCFLNAGLLFRGEVLYIEISNLFVCLDKLVKMTQLLCRP